MAFDATIMQTQATNMLWVALYIFVSCAEMCTSASNVASGICSLERTKVSFSRQKRGLKSLDCGERSKLVACSCRPCQSGMPPSSSSRPSWLAAAIFISAMWPSGLSDSNMPCSCDK